MDDRLAELKRESDHCFARRAEQLECSERWRYWNARLREAVQARDRLRRSIRRYEHDVLGHGLTQNAIGGGYGPGDAVDVVRRR